MNENALESSRNDYEGRTPIAGLDSLTDDEILSLLLGSVSDCLSVYLLLSLLIILIDSSRSTILLGNYFGGSTSNSFNFLLT